MIALVFIVCRLADPAACETKSLQLVEPLDLRACAMGAQNLRACAMGAQIPLARWSEDHPGRRVARWRCRSLDLTDAEIRARRFRACVGRRLRLGRAHFAGGAGPAGETSRTGPPVGQGASSSGP